MILRPATMDDAEWLLTLRNDPDTRRWSRSTDPITAEGHRRWLGAVLTDPTRRLYVALEELPSVVPGLASSVPVGVGRLDLRGPDAELSLTIAPASRGHGNATPLILALVEEAVRLGSRRAAAQVKGHNVASLRAFLQAGFQPVSDGVIEFELPLRVGVTQDKPW